MGYDKTEIPTTYDKATRTGWCTSRRGQCLRQGSPQVAKPGDVVRVKVPEVDPIRQAARP
jgi:hypothetical protein